MKTKLILVLTFLMFFSCEKNEIISANTKASSIIGNWLLISEKQKLNNYLVTENEDGVMSRWSETGHIPLVGNIGINKDGTININHYGLNKPSDGIWKLEEGKIIFYTEIEYAGLILKDTIQFRTYVDVNQLLVLENKKLLLKHKKLD